MSWPRLARPRDLVGSLVWRGDDRATENFFLFTPEWFCQADNNQKYNKSGTVEGEGFQNPSLKKSQLLRAPALSASFRLAEPN